HLGWQLADDIRTRTASALDVAIRVELLERFQHRQPRHAEFSREPAGGGQPRAPRHAPAQDGRAQLVVDLPMKGDRGLPIELQPREGQDGRPLRHFRLQPEKRSRASAVYGATATPSGSLGSGEKKLHKTAQPRANRNLPRPPRLPGGLWSLWITRR